MRLEAWGRSLEGFVSGNKITTDTANDGVLRKTVVRTTGQTVGPFSTHATSLKAIEERRGKVSEHGQGDGKANQRGPP